MPERTPGDSLRRTVLVVGGAFLVALLVTALVLGGRSDRPIVDVFIRAKLFVSTFTVVVLLVLVAEYAALYRDLSNPFTFSLLLFSVSLLLYALTSNPLVPRALGFRPTGLGPFAFIPDLFAAVAVVVLLYQTNR